MRKQTKQIVAHLKKHPKDPAKDVAAKFGVTAGYIYAIRSKYSKDIADWNTLTITTSDTPMPTQIEMFEPPSDPVNHPAHYKVGGIETIDFIEAKKLNYNLGNAVKYITRADHKGNRKQDLEKAIWYLTRELSHA